MPTTPHELSDQGEAQWTSIVQAQDRLEARERSRSSQKTRQWYINSFAGFENATASANAPPARKPLHTHKRLQSAS